MDLGSIAGLVIGFIGLITGYIFDAKFNVALIMDLFQPAAAFIVFGGTLGCILVSYPLSEVKRIPSLLNIVFKQKQYNEIDIINNLADLSEKARKDGLLSLEQDAQTNENELIKKGLALVVDGIETEVIKDILVRESYLHEQQFEAGAKIFESAGGFSPTMGVLGTVMGMVSILKNLSNPQELGPMISSAFVATLYGVLFANLFWIAFATKIKNKGEREKMISDLIIEGLLSIQAGENPRIIKEKLNLTLLEKMSKKGGGKTEEKVEAEE
ncbi:MAG: motility protein A [Bacillota bacterium]|nr:motility protein A [Bacillota bacterium]